MLRTQSSTPVVCLASRQVNRYGLDFVKFHNANPDVYKCLVESARNWMARKPGCKVGISLLWARARWELTLDVAGGKEYRLNDAFQPYYARLLVIQNPEFAELFNFRVSEADAFMANCIFETV